MPEIKPMSEDELRQEIEYIDAGIMPTSTVKQLILTVLEAWAATQMWEFIAGHGCDSNEELANHMALCKEKEKHEWSEADWLHAVKQRVGWKDA